MKKELLVNNDPKSPISEIFRSLRTNIQFMNSGKELKTVLVTSTVQGEGKSLVVANLAITFAQMEKKILVVDADMRRGRQHEIFNVSSRPGLSNYLSGIDENSNNFSDIEKCIQSTEVENLFVMSAGDIPPNPSELVMGERMQELIDKLKDKFDTIIFDGTPSILVTDAIILSRIVDTTIIVATHRETKMDNLKKVKNDIENVGGKIAGVILNRVPISTKKYESSYYSSGEDSRKFLEDVKKEMELRHNGAWYHISPWGLSWDDENYYLVGYDSEAEQIKHYRVDKMLHIRMSNESREGKEYFKKLDMADYAKKSFGMFGGKERTVKLLVKNNLAGVIIDRFGKDVMMIPADNEHFTVSVDIHVSKQFLGWVFSLGENIKILGPDDVVEMMKGEIGRLVGQYK